MVLLTVSMAATILRKDEVEPLLDAGRTPSRSLHARRDVRVFRQA
jgi:hypothetical protein